LWAGVDNERGQQNVKPALEVPPSFARALNPNAEISTEGNKAREGKGLSDRNLTVKMILWTKVPTVPALLASFSSVNQLRYSDKRVRQKRLSEAPSLR
jgi:hypothetical protein